MTKNVATFADLARSYADKDNSVQNASKALREHPDADAIIARAGEPKPKGKGTMSATVAREVLGAAPDFPTRVGPKGAQVLNPEDKVMARRVESLSSWLNTQVAKGKDKPAPDYIALVRQAVKSATDKGGHHYEDILSAVADALGLDVSSDTAGGVTLYPGAVETDETGAPVAA